jgi:hypothetical protein
MNAKQKQVKDADEVNSLIELAYNEYKEED